MLKRFGLPLVLCLFTLLMSGCSLLDLNRFKYKVNSITDDLFSQATITMPVLVTPTSTPTSTPIPPATQTPTLAPTNTSTPYVPIQYSTPTFEVISTAELPLSATRVTAADTKKNPEFQVRSTAFLNHRETQSPDKKPTRAYEEDWV